MTTSRNAGSSSGSGDQAQNVDESSGSGDQAQNVDHWGSSSGNDWRSNDSSEPVVARDRTREHQEQHQATWQCNTVVLDRKEATIGDAFYINAAAGSNVSSETGCRGSVTCGIIAVLLSHLVIILIALAWDYRNWTFDAGTCAGSWSAWQRLLSRAVSAIGCALSLQSNRTLRGLC